MPPAVIFGKGTAGHHIMDVWMVLHGSSPGMQHPKETGQVSPDIFFVGAKSFHGLGRSLEHGGMSHASMTFKWVWGMEAPNVSIYSGPNCLKISPIVVMIESFHDAINALIGVFMPRFRQVQVDHGCFEVAVPQIALDDALVK